VTKFNAADSEIVIGGHRQSRIKDKDKAIFINIANNFTSKCHFSVNLPQILLVPF